MTDINTIRKVTDEVVSEVYATLANNYPWHIALDDIAYSISGITGDLQKDLDEALYMLHDYWKNEGFGKETAAIVLGIIMERLGRTKDLRGYIPNI